MIDHRTATNHTDEKTMVLGLEHELLTELRNLIPGNYQTLDTMVKIISSLIDAKIELNRVQMEPIEKINITKPRVEFTEYAADKQANCIADSIESSLDLEDLPAFLPLTDFTPEEFPIIRNGDRFNVDGKTMHVRFEKQYIPGLRSLKVIKGSN